MEAIDKGKTGETLSLEQFRNYCAPGREREVWFSSRENHDEPHRFGRYQLRYCYTVGWSIYERLKESPN